MTLLDSINVKWEAVLYRGELFVHIPINARDNSKEAFIGLLEFAEDQLFARKITVYFDKNNMNKNHLIRLFNFIGFTLLPPDHPDIPLEAPEDMHYMSCSLN